MNPAFPTGPLNLGVLWWPCVIACGLILIAACLAAAFDRRGS